MKTTERISERIRVERRRSDSRVGPVAVFDVYGFIPMLGTTVKVESMCYDARVIDASGQAIEAFVHADFDAIVRTLPAWKALH